MRRARGIRVKVSPKKIDEIAGEKRIPSHRDPAL
jgi:hypothetical protein